MRDAVEIWGLNEIEDLLEKLPTQALKYKFVQNTYAIAAQNTTVKEARRLAPKAVSKWELKGWRSKYNHEPGNLKKSIGVIKGKSRKYPSVYIGPRSKLIFGKGGAMSVYDGWYAHMIEFGHKFHGEYIPPKPFMRPAWDGTKKKVTDYIGVAFGKEVIRYTKRMTRKMTKTTALK